MRVFASGIMTETNTFCPYPTGMADYIITHASEFIPGQQHSDYGNAIDIRHNQLPKWTNSRYLPHPLSFNHTHFTQSVTQVTQRIY